MGGLGLARVDSRSDEQVLLVDLLLFAGVGILLLWSIDEESSAPLTAHVRLEQLFHRLGLLVLLRLLLAPLLVQLRLRGRVPAGL